MADLAKSGISIKKVTDQLTDEGVKLFADAFDKLLGAVEKNTKRMPQRSARRSYTLPTDLAAS